jgi:hypothetical protein
LDRVERDYFKLFPKIEGFKEASFYLNPDSSLKVFITYERDGDLRDTVLTRYESLSKVQTRIDNYLTYYINDIDFRLKGNFTDVVLVDSSKISGELISVKQNSITIYSSTKNAHKNRERVLFNVNNINEKNISSVCFKEKTNLSWIFPIIGGIAGGIIGYTNAEKIGSNPNFWEAYLHISKEQFLWTFAGILIGTTVGTIIALVLPIEIESETEFKTPFIENDIEGLRDHARYKDDEEPYFLRKIN